MTKSSQTLIHLTGTLRDCLCEDTAEIDRLIRGVFESLSRGVKTSNGDEDEDIAPWIRVCHIQKNVLLKNPNELNELFRDICKMILRETELSAWYWGSIEWNKDDRETVLELVRSVSSFSSSSSLIRVLTAYACVQHDDITQGDGRRGNLMRRLKNESPFPVCVCADVLSLSFFFLSTTLSKCTGTKTQRAFKRMVAGTSIS